MANIYEATFLTPNNSKAINGLVNNAFTCLINSKTGVPCVKYTWHIDNNSTGVSVYAQTVTLTPDNYVYDGETLTHPIPLNTVTNGIEFKHYVTVHDPSDLTTGVTSDEILLVTNAPITITFAPPTTVNSRKYKFSFTYSQAQGIPIEYFKFDLYSSDGTKLLDSSGNIYSGRTAYEFSGFTSGTTYLVKVTGKNTSGITFESELKAFLVTYSSPSINAKPTVNQDKETSLVTITTSKIVQNTGTATGTYGFTGGKLDIEAGGYVEWDVDTTDSFTEIIKVKKAGIDGKIAELIADDGTLYYVGYNGTSFYFKNGIHTITGITRTFPTDEFKIIIKPTNIWIITSLDAEKILYNGTFYTTSLDELMLSDGILYDSNGEVIYILP